MAKYTNFNVFEILWESFIFIAMSRLETRSKSLDGKVEAVERTEAGEQCFTFVSRRFKVILLSAAGMRGPFRSGKGWR